MKYYGKGKWKVYFSIMTNLHPGKFTPMMCVRCDERGEVLKLMKKFREAQNEVRKNKNAIEVIKTSYPLGTLRWFASRKCEIYIVDDDDIGKRIIAG